MNCPQCGKELDQGKVALRQDMVTKGFSVSLHGVSFLQDGREDRTILQGTAQKEAFRCDQCRLVVVRQ